MHGIMYGPRPQRAVVFETVYLSLSICFWKVTSNVRLECFEIRFEITYYNLQSFGTLPRAFLTYERIITSEYSMAKLGSRVTQPIGVTSVNNLGGGVNIFILLCYTLWISFELLYI